ncbi:MAG TPA: hypothetical protein VHI13_06745 [Candidatus Kapabacteria bacterium]|nr:hypothetical protein [Candidatus Kapabacteria bacterium]
MITTHTGTARFTAWLFIAMACVALSSSLHAQPVCTTLSITNNADCAVSLVVACQNEGIVTVSAHGTASPPCTGVPAVSVVDCRGRELAVPLGGCRKGVNITDGCCVTVCLQLLPTGCYSVTITQDPVDCVCP